jgi:S1-C subfamily serine protease
MKNFRKMSTFAFLLLFMPSAILTNSSIAKAASEQKFSQEELVSLSKPSVVRIVQHVKGEAIFKPFSLDLDKLTITAGGGETKKIPIDEYMTGSGFIVSSDGYILTNSHVVSNQQIKLETVASVAQAAILDASLFALNLNEETTNSKEFEEYGQKINDYLLKEGTFNLQDDIVVLDPSSKKEKILDLVSDGFPVKVISINNNYNKDLIDVALIKIDQENLPSLPFGQVSLIRTGEKIGVFGFPSTAELNSKNPLVSTFSQGVVSAIRDSENKDFSMIQTDAKISEGSSGGPLLNENGEVIGMITYQTTKLDAPAGDSFAFAIPIDFVQEGIKKFNLTGSEINFQAGKYNAQFANGLMLFHESKCKNALSDFENSKQINEKFAAGANVDSYVKKCQDLIASGNSIDSKWDKARLMLLSLDAWVWVVAGVLLLIIIATALKLFIMKKRLKKDEKEIVMLEKELKQDEGKIEEEFKEIKKIEEELVQIRKKK